MFEFSGDITLIEMLGAFNAIGSNQAEYFDSVNVTGMHYYNNKFRNFLFLTFYIASGALLFSMLVNLSLAKSIKGW